MGKTYRFSVKAKDKRRESHFEVQRTYRMGICRDKTVYDRKSLKPIRASDWN